ncbi:MAG: hypothetical protein ABW278_07965 [Steroidobacteraceae bacterium]
MRNVIFGAVTLSVLAGPAVPAEVPGGPRQVEQMIPAICPAMVGDLMARQPRMAAALAGQQLDAAATCGCANERFLRDREISRMSGRPLADVLKQAGSAANAEQAQSYITMRGMQHMLACVAEEIDRKLAASVIPVASDAAAQAQLRDFADSVVPLLVGDDLAALYEQIAPSRRSVLTFELLAREAATLRDAFGVIRTTRYRGIERGVHVAGGEQQPLVQVSYEITTERYDSGHRLFIQVVQEGGRLWVERLGVQRGLGKLPASPSRPATGS